MGIQRTDDYIRPRGYYDNKGNLLKVGFDTINEMFTKKQVQDMFDQILALYNAHIADTTWNAPSLQNGWVNFGSNTAEAGYMKDAHGFVHLKGMLKDGITTINTEIFTLPIGYRPQKSEYFSVYSNNGSVVGTLAVYFTGLVAIISGGNSSFGLNGVTFKAT